MSVGSQFFFWLPLFGMVACLALAHRRPRVAPPLGFAVFTALLAAADFRINVDRQPVVAVLVDESASTRGMWFRDPGRARETASRVAATLAPRARVRFSSFQDDGPTTDALSGADVALLMSDGQIAPGPLSRLPTFPVIDPSDRTDDARATGENVDGDRVIVSITNDGEPRKLTWPDGTTSDVPHGSIRLSHAAPTDRGEVRLNAGDRWPENDSLEIAPAMQVASEQWWIGASAAPAGYRWIAPDALPPADAWLAARQVVLDNVPADALGSQAIRAIAHYVRDLGGGLAIVGGDHAFSAGGYGGTELDALSPLASRPPDPHREWLVLIDASGSMAAPTDDGRPRLDAAIDAASSLVAALPITDAVGIASFARDLRAWPAREDRKVIAPTDLTANGPTNLRAALDALCKSRGVPAPNAAHDTLPLRVILLTDGDTDLGDVVSLEQLLRTAQLTIDWVRLGDGESHRPLSDLVSTTGGTIANAGAPSHWRATALRVMRKAEHIDAALAPVPIAWQDASDLSNDAAAQTMNTTWLRTDAKVLATRMAEGDATSLPVAAEWRVGEGRVVALAFAASASIAERAADRIASSPRDSHFAVEWDGDRVTVDAADHGSPMNDLSIELRDANAAAALTTVTQTAPGRYVATVPADPNARTLATRINGQTIDLHVVAGSPGEEFREIGVDRSALEKLAARTGGRVIDRDRPDGPAIVTRREQSISSLLLLVSAIATGGAIAVGRR